MIESYSAGVMFFELYMVIFFVLLILFMWDWCVNVILFVCLFKVYFIKNL